MKQPMNHHNLTPEWLDEATAEEIAALTPATLDTLRTYLDADVTALKTRLGKLEQGITARYGERARAAFAPKGWTGTIHLDDGEYDIEINAAKTVKWVQSQLVEILDALPEDIARHLAKVTVSIDERKYLAALPDIQAKLLPARTVSPGKWKFSFKKRAKQDAA